MNIGAYTFEEFKQLAENFHSYAAPGLLIGGYMVELAKRHLPEGTLFEATVETSKCLPDAVQLLTLCSTGNQWMRVINLGRYALSLYDKHTGQGVRVSIKTEALEAFPEIKGWFLKLKPKHEQNEKALLEQICAAGDSICSVTPISIKRRFIGHKHMAAIAICPVCHEAYPVHDGPVCRGCQGEAPYVVAGRVLKAPSPQEALTVLPVEQAVGKQVAHDMTRIVPGQFKGAEFSAGQRIRVSDICRLQQMGRFHVAVHEESPTGTADYVHENEVAELFAHRMAGEGVRYALPPHEGKIDFIAARDGLFCLDYAKLEQFNLVPDVMAAARHDATLVREGAKLAGTRAIPLYLSRAGLGEALRVLGTSPLLRVLPLRAAKVGILVTGTEVFQGIIEDKFIPVITAKVAAFGCTVVKASIAPDDKAAIAQAVAEIRAAGADLLITTGGLSVDPDDVTRQALLEAGLSDVLHGMPVLPGTMSLLGRMPAADGDMQVLGVPACALYFKTTFFDLVLPRLLANREICRAELARMGEGGYCLGCRVCTYPKCAFGN